MAKAMDKRLQQTVLLVDDEASVRAYVKTVLQGQGLNVLEAADGVDALGVLRCFGRAVDLLITDVQMPRMMGTDLVQAVRSDYPNIPVVYISGERLERELHNPPLRIVFPPSTPL